MYVPCMLSHQQPMQKSGVQEMIGMPMISTMVLTIRSRAPLRGLMVELVMQGHLVAQLVASAW